MVGGKWIEVKTTNPGEIQFDYLFKVVFCGDKSVGKTAVLQRFCHDSFLESSLPTIGVDFAVRCMRTWQGEVYKLQIWDTAGSERYRSITTSYYRGAHGVMLAFDVTNRESFDHLPIWLDELSTQTMEDVAVVIIGNKCDADPSERMVSTEEAENFARMNDVSYFEVSAKMGTNVDHAFQEHAELMSEKARKRRSERQGPKGHGLAQRGALLKTKRKESDDSLARDDGHGMKLRYNSAEIRKNKSSFC